MDLNRNGIVFMSGVHERTATNPASLKLQMPSTRTTPFLDVTRFKDDAFEVIDACVERSINPCEPFVPVNFRNCFRSTVDGSIESERYYLKADESKENYERQHHRILPYAFKESHIDASNGYNSIAAGSEFRERIQKDCLQRISKPRGYTRCRYSESEKYCPSSLDSFAEHKRRIRTRSESEPSDIRSVCQRRPVVGTYELQRNKYNPKRLREERAAIERDTIQDIVPVRGSSATSIKKRESPARMLVYNNSPQIRSPALSKKPIAHRSPSVLGSPRLNRMRRAKAKSASPKIMQKTIPASKAASSNSSTSAGVTLKSKAASSPPPKLQSTKILNRSLVSSNPIHSRKVSDSESSIGDNEIEDDNFDEELSDVDDDDNSSSDSELAYKENVYAQTISPIVESATTQIILKGQETAHFAASLFPNVPPYLSFSTHIDKRPPMPAYLHKILKWKMTSVMPKLIRRVLVNSGCRLLKKTNDWMGTWGKHMKSPCFKTVRSYQKFNHIPGSFKIGRKDSCWRNLQAQMNKHGKKEFGFMPRTYIIPQDLKLLRRSWPKYSQRNFKWIIKPPASARGTGIKVINRWAQIPKRKPLIVQRYIEKPLLINGSKFDLRLYVLVTSINPLRVYMYRDGLVRFASVKYSEKSDTLNDRYMHLTNYSINKLSSTYSQNEDVNACKGHKWTIQSLWTYLKGRNINTDKLWNALRNLVLRTILAGENGINAMIKLNIESRYNCFELFGFDVILDSELVPWLLEVNISPSLHSELPLDLHVKGPLVQAVLNTALYHVPPKLSLEHQKTILAQEGLTGSLCYDKRMYVTYLSRVEKLKHNQFTRKTLDDRDDYLNAILENLTPDDIRCLLTTEDELQRCSPLERIFPAAHTHKYLKYTEFPRYYNRLLDAWEHRYYRNRQDGVRLLQELCEKKIHLDIPTEPIKKDSNDECDDVVAEIVDLENGGAIDKTTKQEKIGCEKNNENGSNKNDRDDDDRSSKCDKQKLETTIQKYPKIEAVVMRNLGDNKTRNLSTKAITTPNLDSIENDVSKLSILLNT